MSREYSAGLVSQSFWFVETKKMLSLIYAGKSKEEIKRLCIDENIFGASKEYRAKEIYNGIKGRIRFLDDKLLELFCTSDVQTQKLIILISILKKDKLFFEFLFEVYREKVILGEEVMDKPDVNVFFKNKEIQSEEIEHWKDVTKRRLGSAYINYMVDANLLTIIDKEKRITPPIMDVALERYLEATGNTAMIKAITGVR